MSQRGEIKDRILAKARSILAANPGGVRYGELIKKIQAALPNVANNTIHGQIWEWQKEGREVYRPEKGLYKLRGEGVSLAEPDTIREKVAARAREILTVNAEGISSRELIKELGRSLPGVKAHTIRAELSLWARDSGEVIKPKSRFYKLKKKAEPALKAKVSPEERFYEPFAKFLVKLGECTKAVKLGGKAFRDKWGTPDVIGYREAPRDYIYRPPLEIVSAEVKSDDKDLITAFGQACAYKIFSHRTYVVVPIPPPEDITRLEALCMILGIGLVLHDGRANNPGFEIRVRAQKHEPDMAYVNKYVSLIKNELGLR